MVLRGNCCTDYGVHVFPFISYDDTQAEEAMNFHDENDLCIILDSVRKNSIMR